LAIGVGTLVTIGTDSAEAGPRKQKRYKKKREWKGVKKYSKRWWQLYRAQERRKKAMQARRRSLRLRQMRLADASAAEKGAAADKRGAAKPAESTAVLPTGDKAPRGWKAGSSNSGELQFRVDDGNGSQVGSASISVFGPATGESFDRGRYHVLAGVPTTSMRREVINRMIRENGWVVNDYQKEIGGKKVYVVEAQSQSGGRVSSRMFYFTEADGRIYSVATHSATESSERLAEESEKVINSLHRRVRPTEQAAIRE
jgi:hypothetical protein